MNILYLQEHTHCKNYTLENYSSFKHFQINKDTKFSFGSKTDFLFLFMLNGKLQITCSCLQTHILSTNNMYSLGYGWDFHTHALENSDFILLSFEVPQTKCDQFEMMALRKYKPQKDTCFRTLPMHMQLRDFMHNIIFYLGHKMYCRHLHDLKQSEWFFLMRAFYTKEENGMFFAPVISKKNEFILMVKEKAETVSTVNELAEACHMTTKTFTRNFKKHFSTTPKKWLDLQRQQEVKLELLKSDGAVKVMSKQLGFSSPSHLAAYCKRHFMQSPTDIKNQGATPENLQFISPEIK